MIFWCICHLNDALLFTPFRLKVNYLRQLQYQNVDIAVVKSSLVVKLDEKTGCLILKIGNQHTKHWKNETTKKMMKRIACHLAALHFCVLGIKSKNTLVTIFESIRRAEGR